jgi:hypothetical protein
MRATVLPARGRRVQESTRPWRRAGLSSAQLAEWTAEFNFWGCVWVRAARRSASPRGEGVCVVRWVSAGCKAPGSPGGVRCASVGVSGQRGARPRLGGVRCASVGGSGQGEKVGSSRMQRIVTAAQS